jgi:hypothetical protein
MVLPDGVNRVTPLETIVGASLRSAHFRTFGRRFPLARQACPTERGAFEAPQLELSAVPRVFVGMTPTLINALHAAETLAAHHRRLANGSTGATREYHLDAAQRSLVEIENIRQQIAADGGVTSENQTTALHQRDLAIAQALIARHVLPEWLTSEQAPSLLGALAQDIADAIGAARGDGDAQP